MATVKTLNYMDFSTSTRDGLALVFKVPALLFTYQVISAIVDLVFYGLERCFK